MITDPITGREVCTTGLGRYLTCRVCGAPLKFHEHAGRPRVQCTTCTVEGNRQRKLKRRRREQGHA